MDIEEAKKILNNKIIPEYERCKIYEGYMYMGEWQIAIETVLKELDRQKEINEEHKRENGELREEIDKISKKNEVLIDKIIKYEKTLENLQKNTIYKNKIKAKIDEYKKRLEYYENLNLPEIDDNGVRTGLIKRDTIMILRTKIRVLEELLED